jgi:hypothetical protein
MRIWMQILGWYTSILISLGLISVPFYYDVPMSVTEIVVGSILVVPVLALGVLSIIYARRYPPSSK